MARRPRTALGGIGYHVMNRVSGGQDLFADDGDYEAFERVLAEARERAGMRVCAYALMPNHFYLVLWPRKDGDSETQLELRGGELRNRIGRRRQAAPPRVGDHPHRNARSSLRPFREPAAPAGV